MGKTILFMSVSLDGYVATKEGDTSWLEGYHKAGYGFEEFFGDVGAIIEGRRTYDADLQNGLEKAHPVMSFVLSHDMPERLPDRSDVIFTQVGIDAVVQQAKAVTDKAIWVRGGANVAQQFLKQHLIDEVILSIVPVALGDGIRLFSNIHERFDLTLEESTQYDSGLTQLRYSLGGGPPAPHADEAGSRLSAPAPEIEMRSESELKLEQPDGVAPASGELFVEESIDIDAATQNVWLALTDTGMIRQWVPSFSAEFATIESEWVAGSPVLWKDGSGATLVEGEVRAIKPLAHLHFSVHDRQDTEGPSEPDDGVSYRLAENGGATTLSVRQGDFGRVPGHRRYYEATAEQWRRALPKIKTIAEDLE